MSIAYAIVEEALEKYPAQGNVANPSAKTYVMTRDKRATWANFKG